MGHSAGIDIGGTLLKLALVSARGDTISQRSLTMSTGITLPELLPRVREHLQIMSSHARVAYPPPNGCGIGIPGIVDHQNGHLVLCGAFGWRDVPLRALAEETLGCAVSVDTDVNAGALADLYFGAARDSSEMLYLSWGTGIGASLAVGRRIYRTRGGAMGNLGHIQVLPQSSRICYCGLAGCLEVEAGGKALVEKAIERIRSGEETQISLHQQITPKNLAEAALKFDAFSMSLLQEAATLLARVTAGALALLNPDTLIIAGGVSQCFPVIKQTFEDELCRRTPSFSLPLTRILPSAFRESAGVLGAAKLAHLGDEYEFRP